MRNRRFSITQKQAETIKMALLIATSDYQRASNVTKEMTWAYNEMIILLHALNDYQWEVN